MSSFLFIIFIIDFTFLVRYDVASLTEKENNLNYKEKRKGLKMTQSDVAIKLGISLMAWQLIERGVTKKPQSETQKKIDKLFGKDE